MRGRRLLTTLFVVAMLGALPARAAVSHQRAMLTASDAASSDNLGKSVAIDGDTAIAGSPANDTPAGQDAGAAYIFVQSGGTWSQQAMITASDGAVGENFGHSVAIDGDVAVVGAPYHGANDPGAAYVFTRVAGAWTQQAVLTGSDSANFDYFGYSVAVAGDTVIVGALSHDSVAGSSTGSAYVFTRNDATWTQQAVLTASDGAAGDSFGNSVAIDGDTAVIGAYQNDSQAGSVYVFTRTGGTWSQQANLAASDGTSGDLLGFSIAVGGDTVVAGAQWNDTSGGINTGSAYVFTRNAGAWTQQANLIASDAAANDSLGYSVAIAGDVALLGAYQNDTDAGSNAGSAYTFTRNAGAWTQRVNLTAANAAGSDSFGISVALDGSTGVVGAYGSDAAAINGGAAYVFADSAPATSADTYVTSEDTSLSVGAPGLLSNDTDSDNDDLSASLAGGPSHGSASVGANGAFAYTPATNYSGEDSFTYRACGLWQCALETATVYVSAVNDAPVANADGYATSEDTPLVVNGPGVLANDTDPDGNVLTASVLTAPASGTVSLKPDGSFTYTPVANANGFVTFTYRATDPSGASSTATVTITIIAVNDTPNASDDSIYTPQYTATTIYVLGNDTDPDGDSLTVFLSSNPGHGTATVNTDKKITYTPDPTFKDSDSFTYGVTDPNGAIDFAQVRIIATTCGEVGPVTQPLDRRVEPLVGRFDPDSAHTIHNMSCMLADDGL